MNKWIIKVKESNYFKALVTLTSGSFLGAIIIAIYQIFRTHIFTADEIGIYTFLLAIPLTFISIMSLRYDISIVTERDDHRSLVLVKLSVIVSLFMSISVTFIYIIYIIFFLKEYIQYIYVIPFILLILIGYGINNILASYNNREQEYKLISEMYVKRTLIQNGGTLILGLIFVRLLDIHNLAISVMFLPYGVGLFAGIIKQSKTLMKHSDELKGITKREMIDVAFEYRKQPLISAPALLINSFSFSVISIIIEKLYGTIILGYYSVSNNVLGMPISLVGGNVAKVFTERASDEYQKTGRFIQSYKKSILFLTAVAIPMFFCMYFLAPIVCRIIFGSGWEEAGEYIKILAPMFSFRLIGSSISQALVVCSQQKMEVIVNIFLTIASVGSGVVAGISGGDVIFFLKILCITRTLAYIWLIIIVYKYSKGEMKK